MFNIVGYSALKTLAFDPDPHGSGAVVAYVLHPAPQICPRIAMEPLVASSFAAPRAITGAGGVMGFG